MSKMTKAELEAEAAHADWAYEHRDELEREAIEILKKRAKMPSKRLQAEIAKQAKARAAAQPVTIRLDTADIECAKKQAERKGLRYQTYIKSVLHEALAAAERTARRGKRT